MFNSQCRPPWKRELQNIDKSFEFSPLPLYLLRYKENALSPPLPWVLCCTLWGKRAESEKRTFLLLVFYCLFIYPLFCALGRNGELIDEATLYLWWEKCFKTHAKNSPSSTFGECKGWWKYTRNLTFVFQLLFKIFICAGKPIELEVSIHYNNGYFKSTII